MYIKQLRHISNTYVMQGGPQSGNKVVSLWKHRINQKNKNIHDKDLNLSSTYTSMLGIKTGYPHRFVHSPDQFLLHLSSFQLLLKRNIITRVH